MKHACASCVKFTRIKVIYLEIANESMMKLLADGEDFNIESIIPVLRKCRI